MSKPVYKVMDSKGRVLIPRELRLAAGMCGGDILALQLQDGKVSVRKVEIVEVGDQSPEAVEAYVRAAIKTMPDAVRLSLISDRRERSQCECPGKVCVSGEFKERRV